MAPEATDDAQPLSGLRCATCSARLAHDQRYCIECGARRGPLPRRFAELIATALEQGDAAPESGDTAGELERVSDSPTFPAWMPAPRSAAVAILLMLALGVYVGSLASPTVQSLAHQLIVAVSPRPAPASPAGTSANASSFGGSGGGSAQAGGGASQGGTTTITITQTSPQSPAATTPTSGTGNGGSSGSGSGASSGTSNPALNLPPIHHVFLIVLSGQDFFQTFSPVSADHYLSKTLPRQGELLQNYYGVAGSSLANGIATISGQGPTTETAFDCPLFAPLTPGTTLSDGQVQGGGCVYPPSTLTIADQLTAAQLTWRAYVEGIGGGTHAHPTACVHPQPGSADNHAAPGRREPYVTWRNPFVYFSSLTDGSACRDDEVGLGHLKADLKTAHTAPTLAYIIPSPCDDGSDQACAPGAPAGLPPADRFLKSIVAQIKRSAAYKDNGLIAITFDEAPQTGPQADHRSCCDTPRYPNLPSTTVTIGPTPTSTTTTTTGTTTTPATGATTTPATGTTTGTTTTPTTGTTTTPTTGTTTTPPTATTTTPTGTTTTPATGTTTTPSTTTIPTGSGGPTSPTGGGGQVGILLISRFVKPGSTDELDYYNHFSLLRSIEDLFGLTHLGFAANKPLQPFTSATYNAGS